MVLQHTKGKTQLSIISARKKSVIDQHRTLYYNGMAVSNTTFFLQKGKVWNKNEVKADEFASAAGAWEEDRDFLAVHASYSMGISDQQFALLSMCPADIRKEILESYTATTYPTYFALKHTNPGPD